MRYAASALIVYAMFAFVMAEPNPFAWDGLVRFFLVVFAGVALIVADDTKKGRK